MSDRVGGDGGTDGDQPLDALGAHELVVGLLGRDDRDRHRDGDGDGRLDGVDEEVCVERRTRSGDAASSAAAGKSSDVAGLAGPDGWPESGATGCSAASERGLHRGRERKRETREKREEELCFFKDKIFEDFPPFFFLLKISFLSLSLFSLSPNSHSLFLAAVLRRESRLNKRNKKGSVQYKKRGARDCSFSLVVLSLSLSPFSFSLSLPKSSKVFLFPSFKQPPPRP